MGRGEGEAASRPIPDVRRRKARERTLQDLHEEAYAKAVYKGRVLAERVALDSLRQKGLFDKNARDKAAELSIENTKGDIKVQSGAGPGVDSELSSPAFLGFLAQWINNSFANSRMVAHGKHLEVAYMTAVSMIFGRKAYLAKSDSNPGTDVYEDDGERTIGAQIKGTVRVDEKSFILSHLRHIPGPLKTESQKKAAFRKLADEAEGLERFVAFAYEGINDEERSDYECGLYTIPTSHFGKLREIKPRSPSNETEHLKIKFNEKSVSVEIFDAPAKKPSDLVMRINLNVEDSRVFISSVRKAKVVRQGLMTLPKHESAVEEQQDDLSAIAEESQPIREEINDLQRLTQINLGELVR